MKKYIVKLTEQERATLLALTRRGHASSRKIVRCQILLLSDEGRIDQDIAQVLHVHCTTVERIRKRFVQGGIDHAINESPRPGKAPKLNGEQTAYLTALACSTPPEGHARWTLQMLADHLIKMGVVDTISDDTVQRTLKKTI